MNTVSPLPTSIEGTSLTPTSSHNLATILCYGFTAGFIRGKCIMYTGRANLDQYCARSIFPRPSTV